MDIFEFFKDLFWKRDKGYFQKVRIVSSLVDIPEKLGTTIFIVRNSDTDKWAVFKCPDNCGRRIEVNLMKIRWPTWKLQLKKNKVSLSPSVVVEGCGAHFWVQDSDIFWARFEGEEPYSRKSGD